MELIEGYVQADLERVDFNVSLFERANAWEGGLKLRFGLNSNLSSWRRQVKACLYRPGLVYHRWHAGSKAVPCMPESCPETLTRPLGTHEEMRCTPSDAAIQQADRVERLVYLHHPRRDATRREIVSQIVPQLSAAVAALSTHESSPIYVHTNQEPSRGFLQQWVQLAGGLGMHHRLFDWQSPLVRATTVALPPNGIEASTWALQLCRVRDQF